MTAAAVPSGSNLLGAASEADLRRLAEGGLLAESHYLDIKEKLNSTTSANTELARDLASFAVDGGSLVIGVAEDKTAPSAPPRLNPVLMAGLAERVESIARSKPDPPLPVTCTPIPTDDDPAQGYLVVTVPQTGQAPHMVDNVYYGRGDKTKTRLSDPEVRRLHARHEQSADTILADLADMIERDPLPPPGQQQPHLFVVARPMLARPGLALHITRRNDFQVIMRELILAGYPQNHPILRRTIFAHDLADAAEGRRRSGGVAMVTGLDRDRRPVIGYDNKPTQGYCELELSEVGVLRASFGRLGDRSGEGTLDVFAQAPPVAVHRLVRLAVHLARSTGYSGPWGLGVAATGLLGTVAAPAENGFGSRGFQPRFDRAEERASRVCTLAELEQTPGAIAEALTGSLLRAYGVADYHRSLLSDLQPTGPG